MYETSTTTPLARRFAVYLAAGDADRAQRAAVRLQGALWARRDGGPLVLGAEPGPRRRRVKAMRDAAEYHAVVLRAVAAGRSECRDAYRELRDEALERMERHERHEQAERLLDRADAKRTHAARLRAEAKALAEEHPRVGASHPSRETSRFFTLHSCAYSAEARAEDLEARAARLRGF